MCVFGRFSFSQHLWNMTKEGEEYLPIEAALTRFSKGKESAKRWSSELTTRLLATLADMAFSMSSYLSFFSSFNRYRVLFSS